MVRVGSPQVGASIGDVNLMVFVLISFTLGSQSERNSQWNMGVKGCVSVTASKVQGIN